MTLRYDQTFTIAVIVLVVSMMAVVGEGFAADLSIKLVVNPSKTDVSLRSDPIALTARVKGKNLEYDWKLLGPGKLEGTGSSVFYILPENIKDDSAQALITVTVKDESGEETTESVTFNILDKEKSTSKGMSKITKVALGAGAVAALGGGIALAAGGGSDADGDGGGNPTFDIVGSWSYKQSTAGVEGETGGGEVIFYGTTASGSFTITDRVNAVSYQGDYTVDGATVTMTGPDRTWIGSYGPEDGYLSGTWSMTNNLDVRGTWWSWRLSED